MASRSGLAGLSYTFSLPAADARTRGAYLFHGNARADLPAAARRALSREPAGPVALARPPTAAPAHACGARSRAGGAFSAAKKSRSFPVDRAGQRRFRVGRRSRRHPARTPPRLATALKQIEAFDRANERFGRPGQAGSVFRNALLRGEMMR